MVLKSINSTLPFLVFTSVSALTTGAMIYICFRTDSLLMFNWFEKMSLANIFLGIREIAMPYKHTLPSWVLYSLPDGLWLYSYVSLTLSIWGHKITTNNFIWFFIIPFIAFASEIGQIFRVVSGTFDITDLAFYAIGLISPFVIFNLLTHIQSQNNENIKL